MGKKLTLLHISDLHYCDQSLTFKKFLAEESIFSKQTIGWLNYYYRRGRLFQPHLQEQLLERLLRENWDYLIISGDITNLASRHEFLNARKRLEPLLEKGPVIFSAGNHDRYVTSTNRPDLLKTYFPDCFPFQKTSEKNGVCALELDEQTVLFEINMAVKRNAVSSRGKITVDLAQYSQIIQEKYSQHYKIVVGHYPVLLPQGVKEGYWHSLAQPQALIQFFKDNQINLYLHGHIHKTWQWHPFSHYPLDILNSGGCCRHTDGPWAGFYKIEITEKNAAFERISLGQETQPLNGSA